MNHSYDLPDDLFGLSLEEVKQAIKGIRARVTNKDYSYDLLTGFRIKGIGRLKIVGRSKASVGHALFRIQEKAKEKLNPPIESVSIYEKPKTQKYLCPKFAGKRK